MKTYYDAAWKSIVDFFCEKVVNNNVAMYNFFFFKIETLQTYMSQSHPHLNIGIKYIYHANISSLRDSTSSYLVQKATGVANLAVTLKPAATP